MIVVYTQGFIKERSFFESKGLLGAGFQYTHDAASVMGSAYTAISMGFSVLGNVLGEYLLTSEHQEPVVLQNTWSLVSESLAAIVVMLLDRTPRTVWGWRHLALRFCVPFHCVFVSRLDKLRSPKP